MIIFSSNAAVTYNSKGEDIEQVTKERDQYKEELFQLRQRAEVWSGKLGLVQTVLNSRKIACSDKEKEFPHLLIQRLHTDSELYHQRATSYLGDSGD